MSLREAKIDASEAESLWLIAHLSGVSPTRIRLRFDEEISQTLFAKLRGLIELRSRRIPLQHLLGTAPFLDFELNVTGDVLIPRPETEQLALRAVEIARSKSRTGSALRILDIGTGSGCLAISIAAELPQAEVTACDVSGSALEIAKQNASTCGVARIKFLQIDILNASESSFSGLDLIVSNPPYIPASEIAELQIEVRDHDPRLALDGGADGLDFYRKLSQTGRSWLRSDGWMLAEFGDGQAPALVELFTKEGWNDISVEKDLSGRDRILIVRPPHAR